jgi:arylsulfatase A-like enzyme
VHALPEEAETIGEVMKRAGYGTFAVSDNINISPLASFHQGFDRFWYSNDAGSEHVNATLEEQAERIREAAPYFLYLHYMDPHRPYARRAPWYAEQADTLADETAAYDSEIRAVDAAIEEAFTLFGWNESAIVIVTADHGEEFLEHGGWDHGRTLYSEVLDLPLLFFSSAGTFLQTRFAERVSILDVLPTLRALVGARPEPGDGGVNLLPALTGAGSLPRDRMLFADLHQPPWFGGETLKSLIHGDEKLIWTLPDGLALYNLAADPGEKSDRCAERRSQAEEAREQIRRNERERKALAAARAEVDLEREQVDKLRALGYVR